MGDAIPAITPDQANPQPTIVATVVSDQAVAFWAVRNWRGVLGLLGLLGLGSGAGWTGLGEIDKAAEERVLRRQAEAKQAEQVLLNGKAVAELSVRMGKVEVDIANHADITRTGLELLMASPAVMSAMDSRPELKARAAKAVGRDRE